MRRTLEAIFSRPIGLLILIVTLPLIGFAIVYIQPRSYQASTVLWALHRYAIIDGTGTDTNLYATPADTQVAAFSQLLQIRTFALTIAKATDLPSTFDPSVQSDPQNLDDALVNAISGVQAQSLGDNLFEISYVNEDPKIAQEVVAAAIQTYGSQSLGFATFEGERLLENYQAQLVNAKQNVDAATAAEAQYLATHPALAADPAHGASIDPNFAPLYSRAQQAQAAVQSIQSNIADLNQSISSLGSGAGDLYRVLDQRTPQRVSRSRNLELGAGTGLGIAILACAVYLVFILLRDRGVYTPLDLQKVTTYRVAMEFPHLTPATVALLIRPAQ